MQSFGPSNCVRKNFEIFVPILEKKIIKQNETKEGFSYVRHFQTKIYNHQTPLLGIV